MRSMLNLLILVAVVRAEAEEKWWSSMSLYQIYPRSFKDSDGNGIGDLQGITDKLEHLIEAKVDAFWLSPVYPSPGIDMGYDISNFVDIDPLFGTLQDFDDLLEKSHKLGLKVLMDFVPNHSSDKHEWFLKSAQNIPPYNNYYIWANGTVNADGSRAPPNNWVSAFRGPAWTWNDQRQAYYYHQFVSQQPDLNFRDENVVREVKAILRFWLDKGIDGFRIDAIPHLYESESLKDEPRSGRTDDPMDFNYLEHIYTQNQPELYDMVRQWRSVLDEYSGDGLDERIMVMEAYTSIELTMKYYDYGAHFPFNFGFIQNLNGSSTAGDVKNLIDRWMAKMPVGHVANWVAGNHDNKRMVTNYGADLAQGIMTLILLLPGVGVTYNGDEIGMPNSNITWEEGQDPNGCNAGKKGFAAASRDPARTPFLWDGTTSAGFSTNSSTWLPVNPQYKTLNLEAQKKATDSAFKFYEAVAALRSWPAARKGDLHTFVINDTIFALSRTLDGQQSIYVLVNFDDKSQDVDLTEEIHESAEELIIYRATSGSGLTYGRRIQPKSASVPGRGVVVYVTP